MSITQSKISTTINNTTGENLNCCCWAGIFIKPETLLSRLYVIAESCEDTTWEWQHFDTGEWSTVQTGGVSYDWEFEGPHRVKFTKEGCCEYYTDTYTTFFV